MKYNYSQKLEMQIPQGNAHTGLELISNFEEYEKLSKDYTIREIDKLNEYILKNKELIPYIHSITPLINEYFPNNEKYLTYYTDPEFVELNEAIICIIGKNSLFDIERPKMNKLNEKLLQITEFPIHVRNLISVRLWWL